MGGLFREEALQAQSPQWLGVTRLATPIPHQVWGTFAALMSAAILLWLFLGHYTQREHVTGTLVPQAGLLNVTAHAAGTVTRVDVIEGTRVRAGAPLATISSDLVSARDGDTSAAINAELLEQQAKLDSDVADTRQMATEQVPSRQALQ